MFRGFVLKVNKWRTHYANRFICKALTYEWLIIIMKDTCNSTHQHRDIKHPSTSTEHKRDGTWTYNCKRAYIKWQSTWEAWR